MFIITDAHVSNANENVDEFFEMLAQLEADDRDIVFLGDIFDLWIGLRRYEEPIQQRFVEWCRRNGRTRRIGFIEGNHEFYVVRRLHQVFAWSSDREIVLAEGRIVFVHGDLVNRADKNYLRFRRYTKNFFTQNLIRFLPFGPRLVMWLKAKMKKTNQAFRMGLPLEALGQYAGQCFSQGAKVVLMGHFHQDHQIDGDGGAYLRVLPDWFAGRQIAVFDTVSHELKIAHWREFTRPLQGKK